jgi:hypothetical protein
MRFEALASVTMKSHLLGCDIVYCGTVVEVFRTICCLHLLDRKKKRN